MRVLHEAVNLVIEVAAKAGTLIQLQAQRWFAQAQLEALQEPAGKLSALIQELEAAA